MDVPHPISQVVADVNANPVCAPLILSAANSAGMKPVWKNAPTTVEAVGALAMAVAWALETAAAKVPGLVAEGAHAKHASAHKTHFVVTTSGMISA